MEIFGTAGNDVIGNIYGGIIGDDVIDAGDGDDIINDDISSNNLLKGGRGNDTIYGSGTLVGGEGDDTLRTYWGGSTFVFNVGDGKDTILPYTFSDSVYCGYAHVIKFGAGIDPATVTLLRSGNDMIFKLSATDQITVTSFFGQQANYIGEVQFADGSKWELAKLQTLVLAPYSGTEAADVVGGWNGDEIIYGLAGNDTISALGGNDIVDGGDGNDSINAGAGNDQAFGGLGADQIDGGEGDDIISGGDGDDIINAGAGNDQAFGGLGADTIGGGEGDDIIDGGDGDDTISDTSGDNTLKGGQGNDTISGHGTLEGGKGDDVLWGGGSTFVFNLGDGRDTVNSNTPNIIKFGAGIDPAAVTLERSGNNMIFKVSAADQITVTSFFGQQANCIGEVQFADGSKWDFTQLQVQVLAPYSGTAAADVIGGWNGDEIIYGLAGNDTISTLGGNDIIDGGDGDDIINAGTGNDQVSGGLGADQIDGGEGDDIIDGGDGDDTITDLRGINTLKGGLGNDTISGYGTFEGGKGDDTLVSVSGSYFNSHLADLYVFNVGDGKDTIIESVSGYDSGNKDVLKFGAGIDPATVTLARSGNDMIFMVSATDQITVRDWFLSSERYIEEVQFADGSKWDSRSMPMLAYSGTTADDTINGWSGIDNINGLAGNDTISTYGGNDIIDGGDGNDSIDAGDGNDQVSGGLGNDIIEGGGGDDSIDGGGGDDIITDRWGEGILKGGQGNDTITGHGTFEGGKGDDIMFGRVRAYDGFDYQFADTYVFNVGDGNDTIIDYGEYSALGAPTDVLKFGAGIDPAAVTLVRSGNDMIFKVSATDQITVRDWFVSNGIYVIEEVQFADGSKWDVSNMQVLAYNGTMADDLITGWQGSDIINGLAGNDIIDGRDGNDIIDGGDGNDTISAWYGNDQVFGGLGDDVIDGGDGDDFVDGGDGDDVITDNGLQGFNTLKGGLGNDTISGSGTLEGGKGDDILWGGGSTFVFNVGDGRDTVNSNTSNIIKFGAGIDPATVTLTRSGDDIILKVSAIDQITLSGWFTSGNIGEVQFADGSKWDVSNMRVLAYNGTTADDYIYGWQGVETINGLAGNDTINTYGGNDIIDGGDGNDSIDAGDGNDQVLGGLGADILVGGYGNDIVDGGDGDDVITDAEGINTLMGGQGNDTITGHGTFEGGKGDDSLVSVDFYMQASSPDLYVFNVGDGKDTINDSGNYEDFDVAKNKDVLKFGAGIDPAAVTLVLSGHDLIFKVSDTDQVTVKDWFGFGGLHFIEEVQFADGTKWDISKMQTLLVDVYNGTTGTDFILGWNGIDIVAGGDGGDFIATLGGNDTLDGGAGDDVLMGGDGDDVYIFGRGDGKDTIMSAIPGYPSGLGSVGGVDTLQFSDGIRPEDIVLTRGPISYFGQTLSGDTHLTFKINSTDSQISVVNYFGSSDPQDTLDYSLKFIKFEDGTVWTMTDVQAWFASHNDQVINGDAGDNILIGGLGNDTINGLDGADELNGAGGNDQLFGNAGDDVLRGEAGNDLLNGGAGNDSLIGGAGDNQLFGGAGDDTYEVSSAADLITELAGEGHDLVNASISYTLGDNLEDLTLTGAENLSGTGNALDNTLTGNDGNNLLDGGVGADILLGGLGDDSYLVNDQGDSVLESADQGIDTVIASVDYSLADNVENLTLTGSAISGTGNDLANLIIGNANDNQLDGGLGADTLVGGLGNDSYSVDAAGDVVTELAGEGVDSVKASLSYTLGANLENLTLTDSAISGTGNDLANLITGNAGDNQLDGGLGADTLVGGLGNDSYSVDASDLITELAGEGVDSVKASFSYTLGANLENLELLGSSALNGTGNALDNRLLGNAGNNRLSGGGGNDYLDGGVGADTLLGGLGDDTYVVEDSGDLVTENANQGIDTVLASRTYTLGSNLENLSLTGSAALNGTGNSLANRLQGNSAANSLSGGSGNDTLVGGLGNDQLLGGVGSDTYLFARGDGVDKITENDSTAGNNDKLVFANVNHDQLWFRSAGNNLEVSVIGTTDKVSISNWNLGSANHVEQILASDGLALNDAQVANLVNAMAAFAPPAAGQTSLSSSYHAALDTVIAANWK